MLDQIFIIISIAAFIAVGLYFKRGESKTIAEFTIQKDQLGWFQIASGISMTFAGGAALLNMASIGYTYKWYTLVDPTALFVGILITILLFKKFRNNKGITIAKLLSGSDRKLSFLVGMITSFVFILILAAQFVALSKLLSPYFPSINPLIITTILSTAIFSYVFWGGFSSVTKTDVLQLIFIGSFLIIPVLYFFIFVTPESREILSEGYKHEFLRMPLNLIVLFSIPIIFTPLSQDINIRVKSARDSLQGKLGLFAGACFYLSIILVSSYLGINIAESGVELNDPELSYSTFFKNHFPSIGFIGVIAALAAIISSLDSYSLNGITSIAQDLLSEIKILKNKGHNYLINIASIIVFTLSLVIALFFNEILVLVLTALLIYIAILLPIAIGKWFRISDTSIFIISVFLLVFIGFVEIFGLSIEPKAIIYPLTGLCLVSGVAFIKKVTS